VTARPEPLIFAYSRPGRGATAQWPRPTGGFVDLPRGLARREPPLLPEASELDVVRHFTRLSQLNFCVDTHCYPLGSCTMKYNPKACHAYATLPQFLARHPLAPQSSGQGLIACLYELERMLAAVTGMQAFSLTPMAGAQGELAGVAMILAYHRARGELVRREFVVPEAAHGTNPATATACGAVVREIPVGADGDVDLAALESAVGPRTAGMLLTNPSTLGLFERRIAEVARIVHARGGLLYYDGANLNAILGKVRPADMGFDVMHVNLHKTFSTPHGGGGPGAGAVGAGPQLEPYLPVPIAVEAGGRYRWLAERDRPQSIGRLSAFMGNVGVLLRAYVYMRLLGRQGMARVAEHATLNANYLLARLVQAGFEVAYPGRRAGHELVVTLERQVRENQVTAMDFAKRLLDYGFHAPTTYFPLLVPECLLIEPTETESKESLDAFVDALASIEREARTDPERVRRAPHTLAVRRLDEARAAKRPDLAWKPSR
jgi:glycine cleavage system P protein (glycine dehydrogenase) subunit 2